MVAPARLNTAPAQHVIPVLVGVDQVSDRRVGHVPYCLQRFLRALGIDGVGGDHAGVIDQKDVAGAATAKRVQRVGEPGGIGTADLKVVPGSVGRRTHPGLGIGPRDRRNQNEQGRDPTQQPTIHRWKILAHPKHIFDENPLALPDLGLRRVGATGDLCGGACEDMDVRAERPGRHLCVPVVKVSC